MRRIFAAVFLCAFLTVICKSSDGAQKPWIEVRSPHFRVLTDGSAGDARRIAREFEQMRAVFAAGFPNMRLDTGAPLLVFAPRDESSMKSLAPTELKKMPAFVGGFFQHGWEKQFAVVRLDQDVPGGYKVVYHEYTHSLLHANFRWLPTWLDEGLADYYGGTRIEGSKIYVGAPTTRVYGVQSQTLIPLDKLLVENPYVAYRGDDRLISLFYGESWALVHYLVFGPGMEQGNKLAEFLNRLQSGEEQKKAFTDTFGSLDSVQKALEAYVDKFAFASFVLRNPPQINEKEFLERKLSVAETEAAIGAYRIWTHDLKDAGEITEQGLKDDPKLAELHENLAFLDFADGKDEDAAREFAAAYNLDNQLYLSLYFKTMLSSVARSNDPADLNTFQETLSQVLKIDPQFAPAFVELALMLVRENKLNNALAVSRKAEELEPSRAGYHLLSGKILLQMGKGAEAANAAKFVADRWQGPDHNEAMELWSRVPANQRPSGDEIEPESPGGAMAIGGTIAKVNCGDKEHKLTVEVNRGGKTPTFQANGGFTVGYSDTLWYGSDHFSLCHHVNGMRAVIWYKDSPDKAFAGLLSSIELREDLPAAAEKSANSTQPPVTSGPN
jgi:tetratricopeptide (TPR) repeat protein